MLLLETTLTEVISEHQLNNTPLWIKNKEWSRHQSSHEAVKHMKWWQFFFDSCFNLTFLENEMPISYQGCYFSSKERKKAGERFSLFLFPELKKHFTCYSRIKWTHYMLCKTKFRINYTLISVPSVLACQNGWKKILKTSVSNSLYLDHKPISFLGALYYNVNIEISWAEVGSCYYRSGWDQLGRGWKLLLQIRLFRLGTLMIFRFG